LIQQTPIPALSLEEKLSTAALAQEAYALKRHLDTFCETSHIFMHPTPWDVRGKSLHEHAVAMKSLTWETQDKLYMISSQRDVLVTKLYRTEEDRNKRKMVAGDLQNSYGEDALEYFGSEGETSQSETEVKSLAKRLMSWCLGTVLGRYDIRIARDLALTPLLPDYLSSLPVCSPGMLIGSNGLPAKYGCIVSEEWLHARPNAITLPPEGSVANPTIPDDEYLLRITWSGILIDDANTDDAQTHQEDIVRRVREVLDILWGEKAQAIEHEACEILGVSSLREYFRKPSGFFQDHLKRYSKSRRKAPIYWPLSTESGSYTLWIYYHRLTDQTLFQCINDFVNPKIELVAQDVEKLRSQVLQGGAAKQRDELEKLQKLQQELTNFRNELLRTAQLPYRPNLNDGVLVTASPLFKLFRLPRWRKDLEECWKKLEAGEYYWAHLAYGIWPERVRKACKSDKSIAIAHGLEELYEEPQIPKKTKRAKKGLQ
jgi:hypothetical protein